MKPRTSDRTLVWAVDPFGSDRSVLLSSVRSIRALLADQPARVHPVYAWTGAQRGLPLRITPELFHRLRMQGQAAIDRELAQTGITNVAPLEVVAGPGAGLREGVVKLIERAKALQAEQIVVSTRARGGLRRTLLGSFAESLVLASDVPLFITRPGMVPTPRLRRVLFPTDFSEESRTAFDQVVEFAAARKAEIEIFHLGHLPTPSGFDFLTAGLMTYKALLRDEERTSAKVGREWARRARDRGVRATVRIQRNRADTVADAVVNRAKRTNCVIALASQSGPVSAVVLGSQARRIVREATRPVWVLHPHRSPLVQFSIADLETDLLRHGRARSPGTGGGRRSSGA